MSAAVTAPSPAPAPAAPAPAPAADIARGVSPAREAWRRLNANRMAMLGLVVVVFLALACVAGPLLWRQAPDRLRPWLGAVAPGGVSLDCMQDQTFVVGAAAEGSPAMLAARQVVLLVDEAEVEEIQVRFKKSGDIRAITRSTGAQALESYDLGVAGLSAIALDADGKPAGSERAAPGRVLSVGAPPPPGFRQGDEANVILRVTTGRKPVRWVVTQTPSADPAQPPTVTAISRDGAALTGADARATIRAEDLRDLSGDGKTLVAHHPLGTDHLGRDLLARTMHGGRISLAVGFVATAVSILIGVLYGAVSGFAGGRTDRWMMGAVDVLYGVPFMFLVIILLMLFDRTVWLLFIALGAVQWLTMSRIVRAQVKSLAAREFILAAKLAGGSSLSILTRHLIPNCLGPVIVYATLTVPVVILEESFLSFLGLGVSWGGNDVQSWGALIANGMGQLGSGGERSWMLLVPATAMAAMLLGLNALGDGLRDALDPRLRGTTG